jgi:hypothetical protein
MSDPTPFPTLRAKRPAIRTPGDSLAEIASVPMQRSVCLQTVGLAYRKLSALHGDDPDEARRLIIAEMDVIDNPRSCGNE